MSDTPQLFTWNAETSTMVPRNRKLADRTWVDGESYRLGVVEERSIMTHNHFFASIAEAWSNLPDDVAERFPSAEHLRRYALIKCGFCDQHTLVASSKAEAKRIAAFLRPVDEYSVVTVRDSTVTRYVARSQSYRSMAKDEFARSKAAVLDYIASLIGTTSEELRQNAGGAA